MLRYGTVCVILGLAVLVERLASVTSHGKKTLVIKEICSWLQPWLDGRKGMYIYVFYKKLCRVLQYYAGLTQTAFCVPSKAINSFYQLQQLTHEIRHASVRTWPGDNIWNACKPAFT